MTSGENNISDYTFGKNTNRTTSKKGLTDYSSIISKKNNGEGIFNYSRKLYDTFKDQ